VFRRDGRVVEENIMKRIIGLASVAAVLLVWVAGPTLAANIDGTSGDDVLKGTHELDVIKARQGDDELYGREGHDRLNGGRGSDLLVGGSGLDVLRDPAYVDYKQHYITDADRFFGGRGHDAIFAGINDVVRAGAGNDVVITAGGRNLVIFCGPGDDEVQYWPVLPDEAHDCERLIEVNAS
jgi:Ca2+-binding RTX toxin-like protein